MFPLPFPSKEQFPTDLNLQRIPFDPVIPFAINHNINNNKNQIKTKNLKKQQKLIKIKW